MPAIIPLVLNVTQVGLCLWAGTYSYAAVTRLLQYEDTSEKAAKISTTAAQELHKTRTTETSGALIVSTNPILHTITLTIQVVVTLIWSCTLLFGLASPSTFRAFGISSAVTCGILAVRTYVSSFWTPKSGVPFIQKYNEGIENSKRLVQVLGYLALTSALQSIYCASQLMFYRQ